MHACHGIVRSNSLFNILTYLTSNQYALLVAIAFIAEIAAAVLLLVYTGQVC